MFKKLPINQVFSLGDYIDLEDEKTISSNILAREDLEMDLFSLGAGEIISRSKTYKDGLYLVLEGGLGLDFQARLVELEAGEIFLLDQGSLLELVSRGGAKFLRLGFEARLKDRNKDQKINDLIKVLRGQVSNLSLGTKPRLNIAMLALDQGEGLSTHASGGDALVYVIEGQGLITIDGQEHNLSQGQSIIMPKEIGHSVWGQTPYRMLLVVAK